MTTNWVRLIGLAIVAITIGGAGVALGYWLRPSGGTDAPSTAQSISQQPRKPLYYKNPDGKPDYSPTPKKAPDGRDYVPVFDEISAAAPAKATGTKGRVLYYRNPMGLADTSPVPKKDSMGMDYIPVREGDDESGVVSVSPERVQMLGVKTAPVELRSSVAHSIRATGTIQADESKLAVVTMKFDVVVEKMLVSTTGATVRAGQPLARVWIQTPETNMQIGPDVITRQIDYIVALQDKNPTAIAQTEGVLRQYGIPNSAIADIRRTGRATRSITITAPRSGTILEKPAIDGMHFNTGDALFKIGDLSNVWLMADVQEEDLGMIRQGQAAQVSFVAFPGRTFTGTVDFISPMLAANTRTGRVRIVLPNTDELFRESMYANVAISAPATSGEPVLVIPDTAIIDSGTRQVVLVVKGQGRYEPRAVRIGARGDGYTQVLDGLKAGEKVVVSANFLIDAESNLRASLQSFTAGKSAGSQSTGSSP
jgi:Cu(I)/Ag(I) efflux system membrane fusion protein